MTISNSITLYDNASNTLDDIYYGSVRVVDGFDNMANSMSDIPQPDLSGWSGVWDVINPAGRFNQLSSEIEAAANKIYDMQSEVSSRAYGMSILPPNALDDIVSVSDRIDALAVSVRQLEGINTAGMDSGEAAAVNRQLETSRKLLNNIYNVQQSINSALQEENFTAVNAGFANLNSLASRLEGTVSRTMAMQPSSGYEKLANTVSQTETYIEQNTEEQEEFNDAVKEGASASDSLVSKVKNIAAAYLSIRTAVSAVKSAVDLSDELTQTQARLNLLLDNFDSATSAQTLFNQIYLSAQDARGSLTDMAAVVARFGNNAKDAFDSVDQVVDFSNLVQKTMTIAGASSTEASNAMLQLSQALGSGVLRGDELNSIFENAPNLIQYVADYMDQPIGKIRELAKDGELSTDVVKNAMFAAADDINSKFDSMPMTWGNVVDEFKNKGVMAMQGILDKINALTQNEGLMNFFDGVVNAAVFAAGAVLTAMSAVGDLGSVIGASWEYIGPAIFDVSAAVLAAVTAVKMYHAVQKTATALQAIWNAVTTANPILRIATLAIAAVTLLGTVIARVTGAANSALGTVLGTLLTAASFIYNLLVVVADWVLNAVNTLVNPFIEFGNFIANVFVDPVGSVIHLFGDMADEVLRTLQTLARGIDTIFGSNLAAAVGKWRDSLSSTVDEWAEKFGNGEYQEVVGKLDLNNENIGLNRLEYGEAFEAGAWLGDSITDSIAGMFDDSLGAVNLGEYALNGDYNIPEYSLSSEAEDETAKNTKKIAENTKNSSDILEMIQDSVSRERIASYTTKQINVDMSGMSNRIDSSLSINDVINELEIKVAEAASASVEGV